MRTYFYFFLLFPLLLLAQTKELVITGDKNYAPYTYLDTHKKPQGMLVDIWNEWSKVTGASVKFELKDWMQSIDAVENKTADIHSGVYDNTLNVVYSHTIHSTKVSLFSPKNYTQKLTNQKVGVIAPEFGSILKKDYPDIEIVVYDNYEAIFKDIKEKKLVLFFDSTEPVLTITRKTDLDVLIGLLTSISNLVHFFQQERGASSGYISSNGKNFDSKLSKIIENTDIAKKELLDYFNEHNKLLKNYLQDDEYKKIKLLFNQLPSFRKDIKNLVVDFPKAYSKYTQVITTLLLKLSDLSNEVKNKELSDKLYTYSMLLLYKESIGQKRAALSALFSQTVFSKEIYEYYLTSDTQEKIYIKSFLRNADEDSKESYFWLLDYEVVQEVKSYEKLALDKLQGKFVEVNPEKWFEEVSKKINLIQNVEKTFYKSIVNDITKLNLQKRKKRITTNPYVIVPLQKEYYFDMKVASHDKALSEKIEDGFSKISKEKLIEIENKWIEKANSFYSKSIFTAQELRWIQNNNILKVSSEKDYPPFDFMTDRKPDGYSIDYMNLLTSKIGFKIEYVTDSWANLLKLIEDKEIDVIHTLKQTKERDAYLNFTKKIIKTNEAIFTRDTTKIIKSYKDFKNNTIGLTKGEDVTSLIQKEENRDFEIVLFENYEKLVKALSYGKVDAIILDVNVGHYLIKKNDLYNIVVKGDIENDIEGMTKDTSFRIAVRKDYPMLKDILNKGIDSLTDYEIRQLKLKWFGVNNNQSEEVKTETFTHKVSFVGLLSYQEILFALFLASFLGYFTYVYIKKSKVLSIRFKTFNIVIIAFELFMITFLVYEIITLDRTENALAQTYKDKTMMLQLSDELRQSSSDLTHFARSYAVTSDKEFEDRYLSTLKIRNGKEARPKDYSGVYWDLEKSVRDQRHPLEKKESLNSRMEKLPFSQLELNKLKESEYNSNDLVNLEIKAFEAIKNNNNKLAIELLYSPNYSKAKHKIMLPIDEMLSILNTRLNSKTNILEKKIGNQFTYILIIGILFILGNVVIYILLRKKVTIPIEYLTSTIDKIQNNQKDIVKQSFYNDEIGGAIEQFFKMKDMIDTKTKELQEQKKFVQTLIDSQDQIIITTDGTNLLTANETFYDFFAVDDVNEYLEAYNAKCICDTFNIDAPEGYLQINMGREYWIDYVISRSFGETHKAMITRNAHDFIFSVTAAKLPGKDGIKSAVFTNITEMENAKKELEQGSQRLQEKLDELNRFQRLAINRELKMIELKKEINQSLKDNGQDAKYKIVDATDGTKTN